jgi:hypothetical protein
MFQKTDRVFAWIGTEAFRRFSSVWLSESEQEIKNECKKQNKNIDEALYKGAVLRGKLMALFIFAHVVGIPIIMGITTHIQRTQHPTHYKQIERE